MPLAPKDGFILSRIDGMSAVGDLAEAMSMTVEEVMGSLLKLESLGLVELPRSRASKPPRARDEAIARSVSGQRPVGPTTHSQVSPSMPRKDSSARTPPKTSAVGVKVRSSTPPPTGSAAGRTTTRPPAARARTTTRPPPAPAERRRPSTARLSKTPPPLRSSSDAIQTPNRDRTSGRRTRPPAAPASPPPPPVILQAPFTPSADVDLAPDHQERIASLFAQIGTLDHYAVLGVDRTTDKKTIKRAYFEATAKFHPDRFFRKKLGPYKGWMEAIFHRMTEAHDTLTDAAKREAYDGYLGSIAQTRIIERTVAETTAEVLRVKESLSPPPLAAPPPAPPPSVSSIKVAPAAPPPLPTAPAVPPPPPSAPVAASRASGPDLSAIVDDALGQNRARGQRISVTQGTNARRDALARRLTGGSAQFRDPAVLDVPGAGGGKAEGAADALKRRYEAAQSQQARKFAESGRAEMARGNVVAAANALRMALTFEPDDEEVKALYERAQRASDLALCEQYVKQAGYEENAEKWGDAARSWRRVARAREDHGKAHERAAYCIVKSNGDLHEAAALAQRAVQLTPDSAPFRVTLANVYLAAGLALNAKRELEAAARIAPNDPHITALMKRITKPA